MIISELSSLSFLKRIYYHIKSPLPHIYLLFLGLEIHTLNWLDMVKVVFYCIFGLPLAIYINEFAF